MSKIVVASVGICHSCGTDLDKLFYSLSKKQLLSSHSAICDDLLEDELLTHVELDEIRRLDRISKIVLLATLLCRSQINFDLKNKINDIGIIISTDFGAMASSENFINGALTKGDKNASPLIFPFSVPNAATGVITIQLGVRGFNTTISGYNPIGYAYDLLKLKRADAFFVGGFEELTNQMKNIKIEDNSFFSYPMSEGAAIIFMTTKSFAQQNNLNILFEIDGFFNSLNSIDNYSIDNSEDIQKDTIINAIQNLILENNLETGTIDFIISSFNQSCRLKDIEYKALTNIFGKQIPPVYYPKSILGETFGAKNTFNLLSGYYYLKENPDTTTALVTNYNLGGNYSGLILKKETYYEKSI